MKKLSLILAAASISIFSVAQTTREEMAENLNKTGGIYFAYPATKADNTPAPKGYKPFHVSHYGRHGSRYLISDQDYHSVLDLLKKADAESALTSYGKEILQRIDTLMLEVDGRGGDLSPLGRRQHRDIAARMQANYPEVFTKDSYITARSTLVPRCILSMASFCESLKEKNPTLVIDMESSNRYMPYLCHSIKESDEFNGRNGWWQETYRKFENKNVKPDRLINSIFSDSVFIDRYVNPEKFMWGMYWIAQDAQNTEGKINFYDAFTTDELFNLWQCFNARFYAQHANYAPANGVHLQNAANLLNNIMDTADEAVKSKRPSAALRFGHDGNVVPLVALMHLEGGASTTDNTDDIYKVWNDWRVSPMGANIQLIFFRNKKNPEKILVKILHNEKETRIPVETSVWPYYDWNDVKTYWKSLIK